MPATFVDSLSLLDDAALRRMAVRAWSDAARCWQEYRAWSCDASDPDNLAVSNMLHDGAWSAEHYWRSLYDACKARGIRPTLLPQGPVTLPRESGSAS